MTEYKLAAIDMDQCIIKSGRGYLLNKYDEVNGTNLGEEGKNILENLRKTKITRETAVEQLEDLVNQIPISFKTDPTTYDKLQIKEGFGEFIDYLKEYNIKAVLVTMGDDHVAGYIANKFGIEKSVHKTDADKLEAYENLCAEMNIDPEQTICVGDGPHDMFSEKALRIKILRNDKEQNFPADAAFRNFYGAKGFVMGKHTHKARILAV
jgi:phosphoserine phosphatase